MIVEPTEIAQLDTGGRLLSATARLLELNARAGGAIGQPLALPQVAALARLARRLQVLVSRGAVIADGEIDLDLWVRADPRGDGTELTVTGWRPHAPPGTIGGGLADPAAEWLWETDAALNLVFVSESAAARHGLVTAEVLGQPLTKLFALHESGEGAMPLLAAAAARSSFADQAASLRVDGTPLRLEGAARLDVSGAFAGFIGAAHRLEPVPAPPDGDATAAFARRLDQALRLPLGRIVANADSISAQGDGPLRREYGEYATDIATAGRHLLSLVDDLVDLQAIERADFHVAGDTIDLADVARRAAGLLQVRAADANVRIDPPDFDEVLPATGEFRRVLQILLNLIGNALRYSPAGGMVWVRTEREDGIAACIVADQGKGIAREDQARIFEKFERVDPSEPGGSGLGLYIARRLARAMGGDITVDSAPGQGARFVFTLPLRG